MPHLLGVGSTIEASDHKIEVLGFAAHRIGDKLEPVVLARLESGREITIDGHTIEDALGKSDGEKETDASPCEQACDSSEPEEGGEKPADNGEGDEQE